MTTADAVNSSQVGYANGSRNSRRASSEDEPRVQAVVGMDDLVLPDPRRRGERSTEAVGVHGDGPAAARGESEDVVVPPVHARDETVRAPVRVRSRGRGHGVGELVA